MDKLNQVEILDKAFHNAWSILVQRLSQEAMPVIFESQTMCLHFIEIYKQLYAKSGGDKAFMTHWFNNTNKSFDCTPYEMCKTEEGLIIVRNHFESGITTY